GREATQAGTDLRGIIASLSDPSKDAQKALDRLGVTATNADGSLKPLNQTFAQLKASGATTTDMFKIFGREGASAASILKDQAGPELAKFETMMLNAGGAAKNMADTLNKGLNFQIEQLKGSVETAAIALGTALMPTINKVIEAGTNFVNNFILPAINAFGNLPGPVQTIIIALGGLLAAAGPVLLVMGSLITAFTTVAPVIVAMVAPLGA